MHQIKVPQSVWLDSTMTGDSISESSNMQILKEKGENEFWLSIIDQWKCQDYVLIECFYLCSNDLNTHAKKRSKWGPFLGWSSKTFVCLCFVFVSVTVKNEMGWRTVN